MQKSLIRPILPLIKSRTGRVFLTLHNISKDQLQWLDETIEYLSRQYSFVHPSTPLENQKKNEIVVTIDDGFKSSIEVTRQILDPRKIKAVIFPVLNFIGLSGLKAQTFVCKSFYLDDSVSLPPNNSYDALTWEDLDELIESGHIVGAHSRSHAKLSGLNHVALVDEIQSAADELQESLGASVDQFAFPFGGIDSLHQDAVKIVTRRFERSFLNVRGNSKDIDGNHLLCRQNIVPHSPKWLVEAIIAGKLDWKYSKDRKLARNLI